MTKDELIVKQQLQIEELELKQNVDYLFKLEDEKTRPALLKYLKERTKEVDVSNNLHIKFMNKYDNLLISVRNSGEFENKSFFLNNLYNWEITTDDYGVLCLIPTKK